MSYATSVDRCEEKGDITRIFFRDGFSFDLPMLVMHKEKEIVRKTLERFSTGTRVQYQILFGDPSTPDGDVIIQGTVLRIDDSFVLGSAGGLIVRFSNVPVRDPTEWVNTFSIVLNFL